jgi:hypothetical protein
MTRNHNNLAPAAPPANMANATLLQDLHLRVGARIFSIDYQNGLTPCST